MKRKKSTTQPKRFLSEEEEWLRLTPAERWRETSKLWVFSLSVGGSLDPEPDPQSPFYDPEAPCPRPVDIFTRKKR